MEKYLNFMELDFFKLINVQCYLRIAKGTWPSIPLNVHHDY
jgi:hypothetical protein